MFLVNPPPLGTEVRSGTPARVSYHFILFLRVENSINNIYAIHKKGNTWIKGLVVKVKK